MAAEAVSLRQNADAFIGEMEKGLKGEESSLFMIPTYISIDKKVPAGERIIVVDAGGTNFRVARWFLTTRATPLSMISTITPCPAPRVKSPLRSFLIPRQNIWSR